MKINEAGNVAHYSRLENLANILNDGCVRLGAICEMADPREASLDWIMTGGFGHNPVPGTLQRTQKTIARFGNQLRVFCTAAPQTEALHPMACQVESAIYGRPRMWAQYAGNSTGFCIILDQQKFHESISKQVNKLEHLISGQVDYCEWLQHVSGGNFLDYGEEVTDSNVFEKLNDNQMLRSIFLKKSIDWRDEHEFRWLLFNDTAEPIFVSIRESIRAVVLGWKFPTNQYSQAKNYCADLACECWILDYSHPKFGIDRLN